MESNAKRGLAVWLAASASLLVALLPAATLASTTDGRPEISAIEPCEVVALNPFELVVRGSGFEEGAIVYLQVRESPARFVVFKPFSVLSGEIKVRFRLGLNQKLTQREIFVENPDGSRSDSIVITVRRRTRQSEDAGEETEVTSVSGSDELSSSDEASAAPAPRLLELQPAEVETVTRFSLLVIGEGFQRGAKLVVQANINAGTFKAPVYEPLAFDVEYLGESLLEISFDRGFYFDPPTREVFVRNPDGSESNRLSLAVKPITKRK